MFDVLKQAGLSDGEVQVYSVGLDHGSVSIMDIQELTGIERRNIYDILSKLIHKGLISYVVEKTGRKYSPAHPQKIVSHLEEQEKKLAETKKRVQKQIAPLIERYTAARPSINAQVFRGKEGIKAVFEDLLNYKKGWFIGAGWYVLKEFPYFWPQYDARRIKAGVQCDILLRNDLRGKELPKVKLMSVKFLPEAFSAEPLVIFIYGNKVVNVLWSEEFFAFSIESEAIAQNYKTYHQFLWNTVATD